MKNLLAVTKQTWKTLDTLIDNDWSPLINLLPRRWHCNLTHKCAPTPIMVLDGPMWRQTNESPYSVHGYGKTPQEAIDDAISQVNKLLTPAS